jgi:hypothetical protein
MLILSILSLIIISRTEMYYIVTITIEYLMVSGEDSVWLKL